MLLRGNESRTGLFFINLNAKIMNIFSSILLAFIFFLLNPLSLYAQPDADDPFVVTIQQLTTKNFNKKSRILQQLEQLGDPRVQPLLQHLLDGNLYYRKKDKLMVTAIKQDDEYLITDVTTSENLGSVSKRKLKKIGINNTLRKQLREAIAKLSLAHDDAAVRLAAVQQLTENMTLDSVSLLRARIKSERDDGVSEAIHTAIALFDMASDDKAIRLQAIQALAGSLQPIANNRLNALLAKDSQGQFVEPDKDIRLAAKTSLGEIETRLKLYQFIETVFFGISLGSVLLLAAIGLAITFGVMGVINMAHGELIMLGAYTTYVVQLLMPNYIEWSLFVAIPAAFLVSGLFGVLIERGVIRFLYGRPLETLLATFGISLLLQQLVRTVFSPLNRAVETPIWMSGSWEINGALSLTYNRLYIVIFSLLVFAVLLLIMKRTSLGLQVRAVSQNRKMAKAMGIRTGWVDALTFGLGAGIAGIAGVALSQLTNVGPNLGQAYIIDSFMVVVFGGVGNLWGTLVGAMSLGVVNKFLEPWSGAVLAKILVLVVIILFIQKRPRGLFPQKGRAAENS